MQRKETAIEVKVGALVLFSIALLVAFVVILGDFSLEDGTVLYVDYDNAAGLKPGADVAISGIKAGKIERLNFLGGQYDEAVGREVMVRAKLVMDPEMIEAVRKNSQFYITTQGVLGEKYIEIVTADLKSPPVTAGDKLRGIDPPRMELLIARAADVMNSISELLTRDDIPVADLIRNANSLMKNTDALVTENKGSLRTIIQNAETVSADATVLTQSLKDGLGDGSEIKASINNVRTLTAKLNRDVDPITRKALRTLDNAEHVSETLKSLTTRKEKTIETTLDNLLLTSENAKDVSADVKAIGVDIRAGRGTIGGLLQDQEIYDDLKEMLRELKRRPWKIIWKE